MKGRPRGKNWHRNAVAGLDWKEAGLWDSVGELQLTFLKSRGMVREHKLLDVGCGCFRAGVHFMRFLDAGNYYAIDKEADLVQAGLEVELPLYGITNKRPNISIVENFSLAAFNDVEFDFAFAHSVFTHLVPDRIEVGLREIVPRLGCDGVFYATYHEPPDGKIDTSRPLRGYQAWRKNEVHHARYPFSFFDEMADRVGVDVENVGEWGHPFNDRGFQMMLGFRRRS
jgi:hypothetical protein